MKDTVNKGENRDSSTRDAEVTAFRALVSSHFDNSALMRDTDTGFASAPDATHDHHESQGRGGVILDSSFPLEDMAGQYGMSESSRHLSPSEVEALAVRALKVLASAQATSGDMRREAPMAQMLALTEAYIAPDERARHDVLARIMSNGVNSRDVIDAVVPAVARYMGELWASDKLSFAEVTIGAARLQETVRTMGARKTDLGTAGPEGPSVMLVVPRTEQHTLGVFVVAEQFRRHGVRVHMTLGNNQAEILRLVRMHRFAMIGVTASCRRTLASVKDLVKSIRTGVPRIIPIVVGGPVINLDLNITSLTGADHVASNAEDALRLCGVEMTQSRRLES